jgi:hypothetical protein
LDARLSAHMVHFALILPDSHENWQASRFLCLLLL